MAWSFSGAFLDGLDGERVVAGTGEPVELPGRYALAGLVDAHAHPTVAVDEHGPYLADGGYGAARLAEYATAGVTVIRDAGGRSQVTLGFARTAAARWPVVTAAGRFLAPANRYFPRMHSPVAPDELAAAIRAEVAAGAAWVKIIGDFPEWAEGGPVPRSAAATYDLDTLRRRLDQRARAQDRGRRDGLPYAVAHGVRILAGTDVVGTIANEIALLAEHGLTARQAIAAAGSAARDFLGVHPEGDIVTYDDDPLKDPGVLAHPAAVVVRGKRVRLRLRKRHDG